MTYPNLNTPKISQTTGYAPNPSPTDPQTNPLARTQVNGQSNTPLIRNNGALNMQSPSFPAIPGAGEPFGAVGGFPAQGFSGPQAPPMYGAQPQFGVQSGNFGQMQNMLQSPQQAYFSEQISARISRPILPRHYQQFYSSLTLEQKLQFFGSSQQSDMQSNRMRWDALIQDIAPAEPAPVQPEQPQSAAPMQMPSINVFPSDMASIRAMSSQQALNDIGGEFTKMQHAVTTGAEERVAAPTEDSQAKSNKEFFNTLRSKLLERPKAPVEELDLLSRYFDIKPSLDEIELDSEHVSGFSLSNQYGEISFSCAVDLSAVKASEFNIEYGNFTLPAALQLKPFIVVLQGIWAEPGADELLRSQAASRGLKFVYYNQELKKLVMSSK